MLSSKLQRSRSLISVVASVVLVTAIAPPSICFAGSAPPITSVQVVAVASQTSPYWTSTYSNEYSVQGQGGSWVLVETFEMGSGQPLYATLNNKPGTLYAQQAYAPNGVVLGYYKVWLFQGTNLGGEFVYDVKSLNYPFNSMTGWIWIF